MFGIFFGEFLANFYQSYNQSTMNCSFDYFKAINVIVPVLLYMQSPVS